MHVYPDSAEQSARALHAVGVAATGDGELRHLTAQQWELVRERLRGAVPIKDHTTGQQ